MQLASRSRRELVVLLAYTSLALVLTYPLVLHFTTHVAGDGSDDPALAWNLWWVRYALFDLGRNPIYTDYMFFPIGLNLAFYTLTYLNAFLSLPLQFTFGLIPAANVNLLLSFTLSGYGTFLLVSYLLRRDFAADASGGSGARFVSYAAFASGLLYAFSSNKFLYASLGQFNIASSHWIPFYILFLCKLFPTSSHAHTPDSESAARGSRSLRYGFFLGLFLLCQALSELIFASFLILFTIAYLIYWLIATRFQIKRQRANLAGLVIAVLTFVIPMTPILAAMISDMLTEGDFIQSGLGFSNVFSADLLGFFVPSHLHPLWGSLETQFHFPYINFVYLGFVALALALIALLRVSRARLWALGFGLILLITLGPTLRVDGAEFNAPFLPFNALLEIPFVKGNRYPSRWSVMLTLCLAVMVGYGLFWLLKRIAGKSQGPVKRILANGYVLTAICCLLLLLEHLSIPLPLSDFRIPQIYQTIGREPGDFTVMELPLAWRNGFRVTGSYRADSQVLPDPVFMLAQWYQTAQQHPILNGNTSRNPELKFQYFSETPVLDSIIAIQEGYAVNDATRARDKQLAPRLLQFFNTRYVIWHTPTEQVNRDVANKTRAYVEDIFPLTKISETYENGRGLVVYRVNDLSSGDTLTLKLDDPLARLYFGEGWDAVGGTTILAGRQQARVLLPLAGSHAVKLTLSIVRLAAPVIHVTVNGQRLPDESPAPGADVLQMILPASILHAGVNELVLSFDRTQPLRTGDLAGFPIGAIGVRSPVSIVVRSAGEEQGAFGHIYVNGVEQSPDERGYNLVVIDPRSGKAQARANFDTCACEGGISDPEKNSRDLAEFIAQIPVGQIVLAAARDEASLHLTQAAVDALKSIGAQQDLRGKFRWSHAVIGVKGAPAGTALESASETRVSQLILGPGATEPNISAEIGGLRIQPE